jgi:hypothetical protein
MGKFPIISSKGNKYIMVLYDYDSNAILAQPIKDRTAPELLKAFQIMEQELVARGLKSKLMKLDNEASKLLETYLHQQDITFQLVPPYSHRRNSAERAIRSFKDHLIAGLCSTDKSFPMHLWDILLPQAVISLNMLRTPPNRRSTWAPHGLDGWYLGPALEHYRCYAVYITKMRGNRIVEIVEVFQKKSHCPFPHPKIRKLRLPWNLPEHSYIHNLLARYVRSATHKHSH